MTLVTVNIEGLNSNIQFLKSLILEKSPEIICLQETWLYSFQNKDIAEHFPEYNFAAKSVDDDDPLPPFKLPRGYGGVATLWKRTLSNYAIQLDGTTRILTVTLGDSTVVNAYLPCRGTYSLQEFQEEIDQLHEVLTKFKNTKIILAGDMNIDPKQTDSRATYFTTMLKDHNLHEANNILEPTYIHHNGRSSSKIDYILLDSTWNTAEASYHILEDFRNTSTHHALELKITYNLASRTSPTPSPQTKKLAWEKGDLKEYKQVLKSMLCSNMSTNNSEAAMVYLIDAIRMAEAAAIPARRPKRKRANWNPTIAHLLKEGRHAVKLWKAAGKPPPVHKLHQNRKLLKQQLRQAQRQESALNRMSRYQEIVDASSNDQSIFFRLIKKQRSTSSAPTEVLLYEDISYTDDLTNIWRLHFSKLASPLASPGFHADYAEQVRKDILAIEETSNLEKKRLAIPITTTEVQEAITKMKNNKAADEFDLTAEHLKNAAEEIAPFLTSIVNNIVNESKIPSMLKGSLLHPIHKKGKANNLPTNYRGISITPILGKILDYILLKHQEQAVDNTHNLQFGFTKGRACTGAALVLSEAVYESKDNKMPLYVAVLDVAKAFDVVHHPSLLRKLHVQGLQENWWLLKQDSLKGMFSRVVWNKNISDKFPIYQGNRQGGLSSPSDYKSYQLELLELLTKAQSGFFIGSIPVPCPTVADDMLLLATNIHALQAQLLLTGDYANQERYNIQLAKTSIVPMNMNSSEHIDAIVEQQPWSLHGQKVPVSEDFTHVGIQRSASQQPGSIDLAVSERLSIARKTMYALMGAGLHGLNGLPPLVSIHIYKIYILPRLLYGLEALKLGKAEFNALEKQHRTFIRSILHLPPRTAIPALHIITALPPIRAMIDQKVLTFFRNVLSDPGTISDIIIRQHAVKGPKSHSWIIYIEEILRKYHLPNIMQLYENTPSKPQWKLTVRDAISEFWQKDQEELAHSKSTLRHLNNKPNFNRPHLCIGGLDCIRRVRRGVTKMRLLTGTYTLQTVRVTYRQATSPQCLLCNSGEETITHFLLDCTALLPTRTGIINKIVSAIPHIYSGRQEIFNTPSLFTQLILDPTHTSVASILPLQEQELEVLERLSQDLTFALHHMRAKCLARL
jgi:exonuclease III